MYDINLVTSNHNHCSCVSKLSDDIDNLQERMKARELSWQNAMWEQEQYLRNQG